MKKQISLGTLMLWVVILSLGFAFGHVQLQVHSLQASLKEANTFRIAIEDYRVQPKTGQTPVETFAKAKAKAASSP